jgi:hypothetical protein
VRERRTIPASVSLRIGPDCDCPNLDRVVINHTIDRHVVPSGMMQGQCYGHQSNSDLST